MKPKFTDTDRYPHGYMDSGHTDIRKAWERARARIKAEQTATAKVVRPIAKAKP